MKPLTPEQLKHGVSLRRLTDEVRVAQIQARLGKPMPDTSEIQQAAQEGMDLFDLERNGNNSRLKQRADRQAQIMDEANRHEYAALKLQLHIARILISKLIEQ